VDKEKQDKLILVLLI